MASATPIYYVYSHKFLHFLKANVGYTHYDYIDRLLNRENKSADLGFSYIDISSNDSISYIETAKIQKMHIEESKDEYITNWLAKKSKTPEFWKENRVEIKVGRFIKRFLSGITDKEAEEFTNLFKSYVDQFNYINRLNNDYDFTFYIIYSSSFQAGY